MLKVTDNESFFDKIKKIEREVLLLKIEFSKRYKPAVQKRKKKSFFGAVNASDITAGQIDSVIYKGMKDIKDIL